MDVLRTVDRRLYCRLVMNAGGYSEDSLLFIALWKWLESELGCPTIITRILTETTNPELVALGNEAIRFLNCLHNPNPPTMITLQLLLQRTRLLIGFDIWLLPYLHWRHHSLQSAERPIGVIVKYVLLQGQDFDLNRVMVAMQQPHPSHIINGVPIGRRTLFFTFPGFDDSITEEELRGYFDREYGRNCIQLVSIGPKVRPEITEPWYAHVVFKSALVAREILGDQEEVVLDIAGKFAFVNGFYV